MSADALLDIQLTARGRLASTGVGRDLSSRSRVVESGPPWTEVDLDLVTNGEQRRGCLTASSKRPSASSSSYHRPMTRPRIFDSFGSEMVEVVRHEGTDSEERSMIEAHIQAEAGFFAVDAPIYEGDTVIVDDPRGGKERRFAEKVKVNNPKRTTFSGMEHIEVRRGTAPPVRVAPVRRLAIERLHPDVVAVSSDLFIDGHYADAVFKACVALETRVRSQSGLDASGRDLMSRALTGDPPPIDFAVEDGQSGRDEQEGFRFILMGVMQGIRNPKGHGLVTQDDPQRALEYLAIVSILLRRLDDARLDR